MAKYTLTHRCGHEESIAIVGPEKDRPRKASWMESQLCYECKIEQVTMATQEWAEKRGLVELQGTDKQVAWAEKIRKELVEKIEQLVEEIEEDALTSDEEKALSQRAYRRITIQSKAEWWIDKRGTTAKRLLLAMEEKCRGK